MKVVGSKEIAITIIYVVIKYCDQKRTWHVSYCPSDSEFRCSCQRMESFGIPCVHVINVLVYLDFDRLPECLILRRLTMEAKEGIVVPNVECCLFGDSCYISRVVSMKAAMAELINVAC